MKKNTNSRFSFRLAVLILAPLFYATDLILKINLNQADYASFAHKDLTIIYAVCFFSALIDAFKHKRLKHIQSLRNKKHRSPVLLTDEWKEN